jgi:hypothetical protein
MKKLLITTILVLCFVNALYADTTEDQLIDEIVSQVDTEELRLIVEQLSGAKPLDDGSFIVTRRVGTEGNKKAADFIAEQYSNIENLDIKIDRFNALRTGRLEKLVFKLIVAPTLDDEVVKATIDGFDIGINFLRKNNIRRCKNILATLEGETSQFVFTTAHYDSMVWNLDGTEIIEDALAPGADDNATGVAATIIAARILSQYSFTNSICFMNPDLEELMMYGSTSYVLQHILGLKRIKSVINIDMIGYDHDSDGLLNVLYGEDSMKDVVSEEYNRLELEIDPVFLSVDALSNQSEHTLLPSDHLSFYTFGVATVVSFNEGWWLSETEYGDNENNIAYHTEEETIDTINFPYMTEIVKLYVATLAREAGVIGKR